MVFRLETGKFDNNFSIKGDNYKPPVHYREHEIAFINEAYAHVQEVNFELDQYKEQYKTLTNQLALATEEQEILEAQLYETGQALDEANLEVNS